jgi:hypothetical protein
LKNSKLFSIMIASVLATSVLAVGTAGAASSKSSNNTVVKTTGTYKVAELLGNVDGATVSFRTINVNKTTLVAVSDLAKALKANITVSKGSITLIDATKTNKIQIQSKSKSLNFLVNSNKFAFKTAPVTQDGRVYVELHTIVNALGGEIVAGQADKVNHILAIKRLSGEFSSLHWDATGNIIVSKEDGESTGVYKINKTTYRTDVLAESANVGSMKVSPNGEWGIFTDDNNQLSLVTLSNGQIQILGKDATVKTDLIWSSNSKKVYFIQGDKQEKISFVSVDTGDIKQLLVDKVENKSEIHVSDDETSIAYIVNITGIAKTDSEGTEDSLTIDYSKAGAQLFLLDLTNIEAKPVQLTSSNDNKVYPSLLSGKKVVYLSADPENVDTTNVLKLVTEDGKLQDLISDIDVTFNEVSYKGYIVVIGIAKDGSTKVLKVAEDGTQTQLYTTANEISEAVLSPDGSQLAVISGGQVIIITNGQQIQLTK